VNMTGLEIPLAATFLAMVNVLALIELWARR
jgi:hypothetical protein